MGIQAYPKSRTTLIDLFYQDTARLTSFYSQIFQGNLLSITKEEQASTTTENALEAGVQIVKGAKSSGATTSRRISQEFEPHDQRILLLLEELGLNVESGALRNVPDNTLALIEGQMFVRNYTAIKEALPSMLESNLLDSTLPASLFQKPGKPTKKQERLAWRSILSILPAGIEFEIKTARGETAIGSLKPDCLSDDPSDLLRLWGTCLPGTWRVLGIKNCIVQSKITARDEMRQMVDAFADAMRAMYASPTNLAISPILIYRIVGLPS